VGYFKGRINIYNDDEEKEYKADKQAKMERIFRLIESIFKKIKGSQTAFPFTLDELTTSQETQRKFVSLFQKLGMNNSKLVEFMKDEVYTNIINKQLQT